jgi:hypothetical protein
MSNLFAPNPSINRERKKCQEHVSPRRARPWEESHEAISCRLGRLGCGGVSAEREVNGMLRERVTADQQTSESRQTWPSTSYQPK